MLSLAPVLALLSDILLLRAEIHDSLPTLTRTGNCQSRKAKK